MGDDNTLKKRKLKWTIAYSKMTIPEAEQRLGISLQLRAIPVHRMLERAKPAAGGDAILKTKQRVYDAIVDYLEMEGYPTEANPDFKEANISDLVLYIIGPILTDFRRTTGRKIRLAREKEIASTDSETGGYEEFVMMDLISVTEKRYILVIEGKKRSLGEAMKQCLLAMKDMRDNNGGGEVYGFVTTGESWRMISYDGTFQMTNKMDVIFDTMDEEKELWMKDYSILVDCMYAALSNG
ncbi:hypothetical protein DFP73DRAFT_587459 [Morchella snyderi]|nr:hypothetical protein DFP73DRAFT_587459 [Morchella snyderi]